jgi:CheY-like chemotaxis protein
MTLQRILLVDDNEPDNVYHEVVLRRAGFDGELRVFEVAEEALAYLQQLPPDPDDHTSLVLLDINMPGMDGWDFARAVSPLLDQRPRLKVTVLTSSSAPEDMARASLVPSLHGYITKPLHLPEARQLLASLA